jgi:glycosyltransferase involved in cell wall biosynthesis
MEVSQQGETVDAAGLSLVPALPLLSIVVPTRDEEGNVAPLVEAIRNTAGLEDVEIVFVDDSSDGTPAAVEAVRDTHGPVVLLHRPPDERAGGLGGAVVAGIRASSGEWVCVMDGDLQHPPNVVPQLLAKARSTGADLVLASRFADTRPDSMSRARRAASRSLIAVTRLLFPRRLQSVSDPLTGFFVVRRDALDVDGLRPSGFKILLEIILRNPDLRVREVGFEFGTRVSGESKATAGELARYLMLLSRLRVTGRTARLIGFGAVGVSGLAVNTLLLALLTERAGMYYLLGAIIATQGSTLWNFSLTELLVFRHGDPRFSLRRRAFLFFLMNNVALALRGPLLFVLTSVFGVYYLVSNVVSLSVLMILRFALADAVIWGGRRTRKSWCYDVHGLLKIRSDARLPELDFFAVSAVDTPDIDVTIGKVDRKKPHTATRISYDDGFGPFGFGVEIEHGSMTRVRASRLLQLSPHVLYTNVVEPILRWRFVEQGLALVHGGCIAYGERAFLVTARTDTGKTTTLLRTIARGECSFLSDDLTLVAPDGRVLPYPKPLTISAHTVRAIDTALLRRYERIALLLQSRVHSRSGRLFAQIIARTGLPAATINAYVQLLIPPPKYDILRLVPDAELADGANLAGLVVIEREGAGRIDLRPADAAETLLRNSADAFGFPPYAAIECFLRKVETEDLAAVEHAIVASALGDVPATVLQDERREWWRTLPSIVSEFTGLELLDLRVPVPVPVPESVPSVP